MSVLNKSNKTVIIIILIYLVIAVGFTVFSIMFYKENGMSIIDYFLKDKEEVLTNENAILTNTTNKATTKKNTNNIRRVKLSDKYKENNLTEETLTYEYGDEYEIGADYFQKKVKIEYIQISGLKNKEIETKINKEIEELCKNFVSNEEEESDEIARINVYSDYCGNFSNVLSVYINKYVEYKDNQKVSDLYTNTLNFKLDTGEHIFFEELFTSDASLKSIITQSAYTSFCRDAGMEADMKFYENEEVYEADYSKVENMVYRAVAEITKTEEKKFYFSNKAIMLTTNVGEIEIPMVQFYQYINIFNLVNPKESLYENGDTESDSYVFGVDFSKGIEYQGEISNYIYLNIYNYARMYAEIFDENDTALSDSEEIYNKNFDRIKEAIIKYEKSLDTDKAAFYNINSYYFDYNDESNENIIKFSCERLEIEKKNFEDNVEEIYQKVSRVPLEGGEMMFYVSLILEDVEQLEVVGHEDEEFEVKKYETFEEEL